MENAYTIFLSFSLSNFLTIYLLKMQTLRLFLFYLRHFRPGDLRSNTHLSETTIVIFIQKIQN